MAKVKGICRNEDCIKLNEIQEVEKSEFVCPECGGPLIPFGGGGDGGNGAWWKIHGKKVIGGAIVALLVGGAAFALLGGGDEKVPTEPEVVKIDSVAQEKPDTVPAVTEKSAPKPVVKTEPKKTQSGPKPGERYKGTLNLSYGKYVGDIVDGKPDGAGVLTYTQTQKVVSTKDVVAEPGERIEGVFEHGKASFVTLYKKDGNAVKVHR